MWNCSWFHSPVPELEKDPYFLQSIVCEDILEKWGLGQIFNKVKWKPGACENIWERGWSKVSASDSLLCIREVLGYLERVQGPYYTNSNNTLPLVVGVRGHLNIRWGYASRIRVGCRGSPKSPRFYQILQITSVSPSPKSHKTWYSKTTFWIPKTRKVKRGTEQSERKKIQNVWYEVVY